MATVSLTGSDTAVIFGRVIRDAADGEWCVITFPNALVDVKTGKDGNSIFAFNNTGEQTEMVVRLLRGSDDDKFYNSLLSSMKRDFSGFNLLDGQFIKRVGDGAGNVTNDTYLMDGGVFTKNVEAKSNAEGDTEQSVSIYTLKFTNNERGIM